MRASKTAASKSAGTSAAVTPESQALKLTKSLVKGLNGEESKQILDVAIGNVELTRNELLDTLGKVAKLAQKATA